MPMGSAAFMRSGSADPLGVLVPKMPGSRIPRPGGRDVVEDVEETLEDEELDDEVEDAEDLDPDAAPAATPPATPGREGDAEVESIQEILVKQEARDGEEEADDEDPVLSLTREERLEPLAVKVVPPQPTEFICQNCYLVKHRSQLKDKAKMLCRDCA
jgi:hypothetical protein